MDTFRNMMIFKPRVCQSGAGAHLWFLKIISIQTSVCARVCVCVCVYVCICVVHVCVCTRVRVCMYACMHVFVCGCLQVKLCVSLIYSCP